MLGMLSLAGEATGPKDTLERHPGWERGGRRCIESRGCSEPLAVRQRAGQLRARGPLKVLP